MKSSSKVLPNLIYFITIVYYPYENPKYNFPFFSSILFFLIQCQHRQWISLWGKNDSSCTKWKMKNEKRLGFHIFRILYIKLCSVLLELFIMHKPLLSEECYVLLYLKSSRIKTETEYHNVKEIIDYLKSDPLSYELILRWIMAHAAIHTLFLKFQAISINCVIIFCFCFCFYAFLCVKMRSFFCYLILSSLNSLVISYSDCYVFVDEISEIQKCTLMLWFFSI